MDALDQPMTAAVTVPLLLAALVAVIWLNVWYWNERRKMTPEERAEEDRLTAEDHQPGDW